MKASCTPLCWSTQKYSCTHMHSIWLLTQKYSRTHMLSIWQTTKAQPYPHALHLTNTKTQPHPHALHLSDQHKSTATPTSTPFEWSAQKYRRTHMHSVWVISTKVQMHPHALLHKQGTCHRQTCTYTDTVLVMAQLLPSFFRHVQSHARPRFQ